MQNLLANRIEKAFDLTFDLLSSLPDVNLHSKIPNLPSNSIWSQFWCIIGARESYTKAISRKEWIGFSCSVKKNDGQDELKLALNNSLAKLTEIFSQDSLEEKQFQLAFDLYEHEIQHHGQLIRFFYANKLNFPGSWNKRYTV